MMIFRIIAFIVIAFAAVAVLLSIVTAVAPSFMGQAGCQLSQSILGMVPIPAQSKPSLPASCLLDQGLQRVKLDVATNKELAEKVAQYIGQCWGSADMGRGARSFLCFELYSDKSTNEQAIADAMSQFNICSRIGDNKIDTTGEPADCGSANSVFIGSGELTGTILIKYEAGEQRIAVS